MKLTPVLVALTGLGLGTFGCSKGRAETSNRTIQTPAAAPSSTAAPTPVAMEEEEVTSAPFKVERIDKTNRKLVVESPDGTQSTVTVTPDAKDFSRLKKGDDVELDYYKASVLELEPTSAAASAQPASTQHTSTSARPPSAPQVTAAARVTSVDPTRQTMQVRTASGQVQTLHVQDPALQKQLATLKSGDQVTVTYTESMAVGLRKK